MDMKFGKKFTSVIVVYAIILSVYVIVFLFIPFNKIMASWISFVFTVIAIISSLFICGYAFNERKTFVSKIYGYPIFRVGVIYALAQLAVCVLICFMGAFVMVPYWVALIISIILWGAAAIGVIITDNTRDIVEEIDENVKVNTKNVIWFNIDIAGIVDACGDSGVKESLEKLNEQFKYSDPVTNDATKEIEENIKELLIELKALVVNGSANDIEVLIKKIRNTLNERNRICKATKM